VTYQQSIIEAGQTIGQHQQTWSGIEPESVARMRLQNRFRTGLDIANKTGTPVYTTADGVVAKADAEPGFGRIVTISHTSGYRTLYGHLYSIKVKSGEAVHKGQIIALMGNTGLSTGPHLHYGVSRNGEALNPSPYLNRIDSRAGLGQ